jgi:hypothetical protein
MLDGHRTLRERACEVAVIAKRKIPLHNYQKIDWVDGMGTVRKASYLFLLRDQRWKYRYYGIRSLSPGTVIYLQSALLRFSGRVKTDPEIKAFLTHQCR